MKTLETQITIDAAPDQVWRVLMDFEQYYEWNPFLISVKGKAVVGARLDNEIRMSEKKTMSFQPEVLVVEEEKEFRWIGKTFVKGLFDGEHYFKLELNADGSTTIIHGENFTGLLTGPVMKMIEKDTQDGFLAMNEALKNRVESTREGVRYAS